MRDDRPLLFVASSDRDLEELPNAVKEVFVTSLTVARLGGHPTNAKPWKGEGPGVFELVEDYSGDTYRGVYTVRFDEAMYVLHVFKKKSKSGIKTPLPDVERVKTRLKAAARHYDEHYGKPKPRR